MKLFSVTFCAASALAAVASPPVSAGPPVANARACSATTQAAHMGCSYDGLDTYSIEIGKCENELDRSDRTTCMRTARSALNENMQLCRDQREVRDDLCDELGEGPYDPSFEPSQFVDPREIGRSVAPNPWFPLISGRTLVYRSSEEMVTVTFTDEVKVIDDVPCLVVRDVVEIDGELAEDTIDWYAQDIQGNVWYCGEATAEYEDGFPVNVDGSFQADENGARPGLIAQAAPTVGAVYRQEFDLANAEDVAEVIDLQGSASTPWASCDRTCLVTKEFTPISPDLLEHKYYKPGLGFILQENVATGERVELVEVR
jgi:hypothetical protein